MIHALTSCRDDNRVRKDTGGARRQPATGFSDFWQRWHIFLSSWLRNYLYISLGGSRRRVPDSGSWCQLVLPVASLSRDAVVLLATAGESPFAKALFLADETESTGRLIVSLQESFLESQRLDDQRYFIEFYERN